MRKVICAIRDAKAEVFGRPIFVNAIGEAIRLLSDEVNSKTSPDNVYANHPGDFALYELGTFDDNTGCINSLPIVKIIVQADQLVERKVKEDA